MEEEIDIKEILITLWKKKYIIIVISIVFGLIASIFSGLKLCLFDTEERTNSYVETNLVLFDNYSTITNNSSTVIIKRVSNFDDATLATYAEMIKSYTSINSIINELQLDISYQDLYNAISVSRFSRENSSAASYVINITLSIQESDQGKEILNKLTDNFNNYIKENTTSYISVIDEPYANTYNEFIEKSNTKSAEHEAIKTIITATILGFILSIGGIIAIETIDDTLKNENSLETLTDVNVLVKIKNHKADASDSFAMLRANINNPKSLLVTSSETISDTAYVAQNLSSSFAKANKKVLLVDLTTNESDLLEKYNDRGLSEFINSKAKEKSIKKYINKTTTENFDLLLAGKNLKYLDEEIIQEIYKTIEKDYSTIIINSPDVLDNVNSLMISKLVKGTVIVATERKTKVEFINKSKKLITDNKGNVLGCAFLEKLNK